jgi:hypothetical protein
MLWRPCNQDDCNLQLPLARVCVGIYSSQRQGFCMWYLQHVFCW